MTTVTIECNEAGLTKSGSQWAVDLMKDHKNAIPDKYKAKIDKISRNAYKNEDEPQMAYTLCPFCRTEVPEYNLECKRCYNVIPFCIASGKHVTFGELTKCPHCNFPAMLSELRELMVNDVHCPMCDKEIDAKLMEKMDNPVPYLETRKVRNLCSNTTLRINAA
jgi:WD repeat-containing protein 19